jgi:putative ABC transport system permease protein
MAALFNIDFSRGSTWLHMGNLCMGMLIFVAAQSFASSILRSVENAMDRLGTNLVMISDRDGYAADRVPSLDWQAWRTLVARFGGSYDLVPVTQTFGRVSSGPSFERPLPVWAVPPEFFPMLRLSFRSGRPFTALERDAGTVACVLGAGVADNTAGLELGMRLMVGGQTCRLTGIVEKERIAHSQNTAHALFISASNLPPLSASLGPLLTHVFMRKKDGDLDPRIEDQVAAVLAATHDVARIEVWAASEYWEARRRVVLGLGFLVMTIATVIVALAATSLAGGLLLDVTLRRGEIGLRMALGATRESVFVMVTLESLVIVLCGGGAGIAAGAALTQFVFSPLAQRSSVYSEPISIGIDGTGLAISLFAMLVAAIGASLIPARSAARTEPSLALRDL